ncbi:uncharacterized protein LOC142821332 [Pelodiscus sinensis]|uniref:uncharacterized protein LOC142821332 n=1 Tax=Pelodiscus sinensis TaxID=13735 RepID=UPI003F6D09E0
MARPLLLPLLAFQLIACSPQSVSVAGEARISMCSAAGTDDTTGIQVASDGRKIPSSNITRLDPPPQPVLRAVREGHSLNITCTAPRDASERRFNFYKDGVNLHPEGRWFEIRPTEPRTGSGTVSVLSILHDSPHFTGNYICWYEEKMNGRWIPSLCSQFMTVTDNGPGNRGSLQGGAISSHSRFTIIPKDIVAIKISVSFMLAYLAC